VNDPTHWTNPVSRAAWTLLGVAVVAFIAWRLLRPLLPALVVLAAVTIVYRTALGSVRRDRF
jgi:hypothetical protein